jgi:hypothetical protein
VTRALAASFAVAAAITLAACSADPAPPNAEPTPTDSSEGPAPTSPTGGTEAASGPSGAEVTEPGAGMSDAVNLCEELELATLGRLTGLELGDGAFDGAACTWTDPDAPGALTMSLGVAEGTVRQIQEVKGLDIGAEVSVAGTDDAAAVTIVSGSGASESTRVALVAKIGRERLTVILTGRDANLDAVIALAELVTGA